MTLGLYVGEIATSRCHKACSCVRLTDTVSEAFDVDVLGEPVGVAGHGCLEIASALAVVPMVDLADRLEVVSKRLLY
jgi:hypothetical protein